MAVGSGLPFNNTNRLDGSETGQGIATLLAVKDSDRCADDYCSVSRGKRLFSIQVKYEASEGQVPYNPSNWSLVDAEGQQYNEVYFSPVRMGQALSTGDLGKGRTVKGVIAFEIPKTAVISSVDFSNIGDWKVQ